MYRLNKLLLFAVCAGYVWCDDIVIVDNCEGDWVNSMGNCYYIANDKVASQSDALKDCNSRQGDLLIIETADELQLIVDETSAYTSDGWWTKLQRQLTNNRFYWGLSYPPDRTVITWNTEPDNANGIENCGTINEQVAFSDADCGKKYGVLCELKQAGCPLGWLLGNDECFFISDTFNETQLMTWQEANQFCAALVLNARLADMSDQSSQDYLSSVLPEQTQTTLPWWVSLNRKNNQWYWGATRASQATLDVINWVQEPNNLNGVENCGMIYNNGKFADKDCDRLANYICKKIDNSVPLPYASRSGCGSWTRAGDKCYYFQNDFTETRDVARSRCVEQDGDLLKIESMDEKTGVLMFMAWFIDEYAVTDECDVKCEGNRFVVRYTLDSACFSRFDVLFGDRHMNYIEYMTRRYSEEYWTQLSAPSYNGQWTFSDGSTPTDALLPWNAEPNDYSSVEDCVLIFSKLTWNDESCRTRTGYICEALSNGMSCPQNWTSYSDSCYYFGPGSRGKVNWWMARRICTNLAAPMAGKLLSIEDPNELAFINQQLTNRRGLGLRYWTGLNDVSAEGMFEYDSVEDEPRLDLIPWDISPSCADCTPACALLVVGGTYVDSHCTDSFNYICEKYVSGGSNSLGGRLLTVEYLMVSIGALTVSLMTGSV